MTFAKLARLSKGIQINSLVRETGLCSRKRYRKFENGGQIFSKQEIDAAAKFLGIDAKLVHSEVVFTKNAIALEADKALSAPRHTRSGKECAANAPSPG